MSMRIADETIIAIHRDNRTTARLAQAYGVSTSTVLRIKNGSYRKDLHLGKTPKRRREYTEKLLGKKKKNPATDKYNYRLWRVASDPTTWHLPERPQ